MKLEKFGTGVMGMAAIGVLALSGCGGSGGNSDAGGSSDSKPACEQDASDSTTIDSAPKVDWKTDSDDPIKYATSDDLGPAKEKDGIQSCFQHSPEGALLASTYYDTAVLNSSVTGNWDDLKKLVKEQGAKSAARDSLVKDSSSGQSADPSQVEEAKKVKVVGYKLDNYTKDEATVKVLLTSPEGSGDSYGALSLPVKWEDGDWKLDVSKVEDSGSFSSEVKSMDGYEKWGPDSK